MTLKRQLPAESKTREVCERLRELAYEMGPGTRLPTVRALCDLLSTTYVTLGEALDQLEAENILYRKQRQGIFVSPTLHHKTIVILFESSGIFSDSPRSSIALSPFWSLLWAGLENEAQRRSTFKNETCTFQLVKAPRGTHELPADVIERLKRERIDGLMTVNLNVPPGGLAELPVPCVSFAGGGPWIVQLDGEEIGRQAARSLIQQGCQRIGLWLPYHEQTLEETNEVRGLRQALSEHRLPYYPELVRRLLMPPGAVTQSPLSHQEQGYFIAHDVFGGANSIKPDGLFIADDLMTDGALVALEELGLREGIDCKIATHANAGSPILFGRTKHMHVFEYDANNVVLAMFSLLDQLMAGQTPAENVVWIRPRQRA